MRRIAPLVQMLELLPRAQQTIYNLRAAGKAPWLSHVGPDGRVGKILWIDIDMFNHWAPRNGFKCRLPSDHISVVEVEEVPA